MATDFRTVRLRYAPTSGQIQNKPGTAVFNGRVRRAALAVGGWDMEFTNGDHHVRRQRIDILHEQMQIQNNTVTFSADFLLRDNSGNIDDPFKGDVDVLVIADVDAGGTTTLDGGITTPN